MAVLLIANIGNRDVGVEKSTPIPGEVNPCWNKNASRRALGQALLKDWSHCKPHLTLPIIGKAMDHVRQRSGQPDRVVLIASDQSSQEGVADHHLEQDTCELAPVVEKLMVEQYGLAANAVTHWTAPRPADYGAMQALLRDELAKLHKDEPEGTFYLEVSGGTPAMTSMLLTVGAEILGLDAQPLYVSEHEEQPFPLDLGRRLVAESLLQVVQQDVAIYAYHAAARTVAQNLKLLQDFVPARSLLALLAYARQRLNFNFDQARQAISNAPDGPWSEQLNGLAADLHPDQPEWLLHEIIYNAETRLEIGAYGDFLTRVFRFDEGALRYTVRKLGAYLVDKKGRPDPEGEFLDPTWLDGLPELKAHLRQNNVRVPEKGKVGANRYVMSCVIAFLADQQGDEPSRTLLERLRKINRLSGVRNRSFAVHTFDGVSRRRIAQALTGKPEVMDDQQTETAMKQVVETLRETGAAATSHLLPTQNPFKAINQLCGALIAKDQPSTN